MTRCTKNEVNLKSSAYNQTGQNYFEQLTAYNSMSLHIRRILLARSVVDARNKNYISRKNKRCELADDKRIYSCMELGNDVIDRLAYDTRHHPMDILRMNLNPKRSDCYNYNLEHRQSRICNCRSCCEDRMDRQQRSTSRNRKMTSPRDKKFTSKASCEKECETMRETSRIIRPSMCCIQQRKCRSETNPLFVPCTTVSGSSKLKSASHFLIQETHDHRSVSSSASQSYDSDYDEKFIEQLPSKQLVSQKEEEKKYVKFVYDITREIMQSGLYTDKELQDVFKKHIDQNKGILNMNKMLYEIYQLKISLNIMEDDSDVDDELEDLIHAQKLLTVSEIRPPTPPKVLDENKVIEKLESYQKLMESQPSGTGKSVVLIDANPELFVTERDVLMSLMEVGIDPKQAQHVCKSLLYRSKDTALAETVQVGAEASYPSNSQTENLETLRDNNRQTSSLENCRASIIEGNSIDSSEKLEANSSTSNLARDETTEAKEKNDSRRPSNDSKIES